MTTNQQIADAAQSLVGMKIPPQPNPLLHAVGKIIGTIYEPLPGLADLTKIHRSEKQPGNIVQLRFPDGKNEYGILTKRADNFYIVRVNRDGVVVEHILNMHFEWRITEFLSLPEQP
jgi:hypothetical protein